MKKLDKFSSKKLNSHDLQAVQGGSVTYFCTWWGWGYCLAQRKQKRGVVVCSSSPIKCITTYSGQGCC